MDLRNISRRARQTKKKEREEKKIEEEEADDDDDDDDDGKGNGKSKTLIYTYYNVCMMRGAHCVHTHSPIQPSKVNHTAYIFTSNAQ